MRPSQSPHKIYQIPENAGPNLGHLADSKVAPSYISNSESVLSLKKLASKNPKFQMDSNLSGVNFSKSKDSITHSTSNLVQKLRDSNSISVEKL